MPSRTAICRPVHGLARARPLACCLAVFVALAVTATSSWAGEAAKPGDEAARFFETKIRPVLVARCYECHGPGSKAEGNLRLDSRASLLKGGDSGPAVKPGDPKASLLVDAVNHGDVVQMPPKKKLPAEEIANLTTWVAGGAVWPDSPAAEERPAGQPVFEIRAADREFWAFQPPAEPEVPAVNDAAWPSSPIDRFVLAPLEARGLRPAARPTGGRSFAGRRSICTACRPAKPKSRLSWPTRRATPGSGSSIGCWLRPGMASVGAATGSTSPGMPTATAWTRTWRWPTPGAIATG